MNFNNVKFLTSFGRTSQIHMPERIEIAFSGRSNVGKSSLINKIFNRKNLARVSAVPGKTITINFFDFENIYIVDLPGYGYAKIAMGEKERWAELIEDYLNDDTRRLELVFQLIDIRHAPSNDDLQMIDFLVQKQIPFVIILTKADKLKPTARKERLESFKTEIPYFDNMTVIPFSSKTGEGVDQIKAIIEDVSVDDTPETEENEEA